MATTPLNRVIQHLLAASERDGMTDEELITRFLDDRDDAALAALVGRHAPMVWGVCCRLLRSRHDAEDAFQATFLVLVQKAATLPNREKVGNWLYGVARQTAVRMRALAAKRGVRERQVTVMPEPITAEQYVWNDLVPVLDEELSRLPDKYRILIVLCDLEGVTRKEAARQLNLPEGTAASRLTAARAMLAKRLARRGIVVSSMLLGAVLAQQPAWAIVPTTVINSTINAATLVAAGKAAAGAISPTVAAVKIGVMRAMFMSKIKTGTALVLGVGLTLAGIGAGVGFSTNPAAVAQQPGVEPPDVAKKSDPKELPKQGDKVRKDDSGRKPAASGAGTAKEHAVVTPEQIFRGKLTGPVRVEFTVTNYNQVFPLLLPGDTTTPKFIDILEPKYNEGSIDTLQVYLPEKVAARFSQLGIDNVRSHLFGKVIRVSGTLQRSVNAKDGSNYSLVIESLDQFESIGKKVATGPGKLAPTPRGGSLPGPGASGPNTLAPTLTPPGSSAGGLLPGPGALPPTQPGPGALPPTQTRPGVPGPGTFPPPPVGAPSPGTSTPPAGLPPPPVGAPGPGALPPPQTRPGVPGPGTFPPPPVGAPGPGTLTPPPDGSQGAPGPGTLPPPPSGSPASPGAP